jgi:hypothetical protein
MLLNFILPSVDSHAENFSLFKRQSHPPCGRKIKIVVAAPRASRDEIKKICEIHFRKPPAKNQPPECAKLPAFDGHG